MQMPPIKKDLRFCLFVLNRILPPVIALIFLSTFILAERLSFATYSMADGLANDSVNKIYPDSRGFLWFATDDGLSRFDGYKFKNYTQEDGLPHRSITDFLETKDGTYLIATPNGLAVFNPTGKIYRWDIIKDELEQNSSEPPLFKTYFPKSEINQITTKSIIAIAQDRNGNIYVATRYGFYRFVKITDDWQFQKIENDQWNADKVESFGAVFADSRGDVWIASDNFIYRMRQNGEIEKVSEPGGKDFFEDKDGNIWINSGGHELGIRVFSIQNDKPVLKTIYTKKDGLPRNAVSNAVAQLSNGQIVIISDGKIGEFVPQPKTDEPNFQMFPHDEIQTAAIDQSGNLWFGTFSKGAWKRAVKGFQVFDQRDGLPTARAGSLFGDQKGELLFTYGQELARYADGKFEFVKPFGSKNRSWGAIQLDHRSRNGEWWIPTIEGLLRYPKVTNFKDLANTRPIKTYGIADGLPSNFVHNIFEDSKGNLWISCVIDGANAKIANLQRLEISTGKIHSYPVGEILPEAANPVSFAEDANGNIWVGFQWGGLIRVKDEKIQLFEDSQGIPRGYISQMMLDEKGRLWIASRSRGLFRVDNPNDDVPRFISISTANGLSSNQTLCLTKDSFGRIFIGTGRGLNRLNPETGQVKIYTDADGLPGNVVHLCHTDGNGELWFSALNPLFRLNPEADSQSAPPPIFIDEIRVNGVPKPISQLGETEVKDLEFGSDERQIQIGFFGLSFKTGEKLLYQYKFSNQDWSEPSDQRTVAFNLSAGEYDFQVRAINADGTHSERTATISFKINPPFWRTWWFIALIILMLAGSIFALDRYRVSKTRQVEDALVQSRESETRFRTLADTASDAILTIDADSKIIFVNQAIEKVFGYAADELIGKPMTMLMPERMRDGHNAGINRYLTTNNKHVNWESVALPGLHKDGYEIPLEVSFGEFERDGQRYFTGIARDVSERKRAEEALQEAREEKFRELERVRTRIATDLHDDIGSSLTQIGILSEVAGMQANQLNNENLSTPLNRIKGVSKELVSVMSDIVWAINPTKDTLPDLIQRMRRFGSDVLSGRGIRFEFHTPEVPDNFQLGANIRREVFAIFKESVNNSVKYAEATVVKVDFQIRGNWLILKIKDNGKGFDTAEILSEEFKPELGGNGLVNMRRRAKDLGGNCKIVSEINNGTKITLEVPLSG